MREPSGSEDNGEVPIDWDKSSFDTLGAGIWVIIRTSLYEGAGRKNVLLTGKKRETNGCRIVINHHIAKKSGVGESEECERIKRIIQFVADRIWFTDVTLQAGLFAAPIKKQLGPATKSRLALLRTVIRVNLLRGLLGRHYPPRADITRVDCADYVAVDVTDIHPGRTKEGRFSWRWQARKRRKTGNQLAARQEFTDVKVYWLTQALTRFAAHHLSGLNGHTVWARLIVAATKANILRFVLTEIGGAFNDSKVKMIGMILHHDLCPGDGRSHRGRPDLAATRVFRHTQKDRAAFQINCPCSAFEAKDRLRPETGDSHILKSQLGPGLHASSHRRVFVDAVIH